MKKINISKKYLVQKYVKENKFTQEIAKKLNCCEATISNYLKKYNINSRNKQTAINEYYKRNNKQRKPKYCMDCLEKGIKTEISYRAKRCKECNCKTRNKTTSKYYCIDCGEEIHYRTWKCGNKKCGICFQLGHKVSEITRRKIGNRNKGKNNGNYINGKSYEPYTKEFNNKLKRKIRKRDNYICQGKDCSLTEEEHIMVYSKLLSVHHIDYNKQNCEETNLISLCQECNMKANYNRNYWFAYFRYIIN